MLPSCLSLSLSLPAPPHAALPEQFAKLDTLKWLAHRAFANVRQAFREIQV
jgi:hypothetical protein